MRKHLLSFCFGLGAVAVALPLYAYYQDMGGKKEEPKKGAGAQEGDDEMKKMMEAWEKVSKPGMHHDHLKPMAGKWKIAGKFRAAAEAPWDQSTSTANTEWIMGGRFLLQNVKGDEPMMEGQPPFEGLGIMGYDNLKKKYNSAWVDNMSTVVAYSEGTCDNSGKTITTTGRFIDAQTNKETTCRMVYKITSNDKFTLESFCTGPDGKEFCGMELTFTRTR